MEVRILIVIASAALILAGWASLRLRQSVRLRAIGSERIFHELVPAGRPAVVAFSLAMCHECHYLQAPAISLLEERLGDRVRVQVLDVKAHSDLAGRLGILTVPATVVLDADGIVRYVNQGFADERRLAEEVSAIA